MKSESKIVIDSYSLMFLWLWLLSAVCTGLETVRHASTVNRGNSNKELVAYIHPGPGKTGTTHLQAFMIETEKTLLENDFAVWPDLTAPFEQCKSNGSLGKYESMSQSRIKHLSIYYKYFKKCPLIQDTMREFIQHSAKSGRNIILSSETFLASHEAMKNILDMLLSEKYVIHGILTYRFSLNWMLSLYKEEVSWRSIASPEKSPSAQMSRLLLSDFMSKKWDQYLSTHVIYIFHNLLATYADTRFSILDLYGTEAAQEHLSFAFLCQAMRALCDKTLHEKHKDLKVHPSESQSVIDEKQVAFVFVKFALRKNCSMNFSERNSPARKFIREIINRRKWGMKPPLRRVNVSHYAELSLAIDKKLRQEFLQNFVNGNVGANEMKVKPIPIVEEVDENFVSNAHNWVNSMTKRLGFASKKGLCSFPRHVNIV